MSKGLIVIWRTLIIYLFWRFPIKAKTRKIDSKCININSPGPNENTDLNDQTAFRTKAAAEPEEWNFSVTFA